MVFRICRRFTVECGHLLSKHEGRCRYPHGHSQTIEIVLESDRLNGNDMVCDFRRVKEAAGEVVEVFDHAMCLNTRDPLYETLKARFGKRVVGFPDEDPTCEVLAKTLFDRIGERIRDGSLGNKEIRLVRVRVHETGSSWAEYARE